MTSLITQVPPAPDPFLATPVAGWLLRRRHLLKRLDRRRPWLLDTAVPVVVLLFSLPEMITETDSHDRLAVVAFAAVVLLPLWWRRRAPALAYAGVAVVLAAQWSAGFWHGTGVGLLVVLHGVATRSSMRTLLTVVVVTAVQFTFAIYVLRPPLEHRLAALLLLLGTCSAAVAGGLALRTLRAYHGAQADRAAHLEAEQDQRAQLAVAGERARIAREMHDLVGHHVSIMIGLADGGAALAASRGERTAEPLRLIADTGRSALDDLRRLLGVLRDDDADPELRPQPGIADLERLLPSLRVAGLTISYGTTGELDRLGQGLQLAVYRIVQEALTNTLKHAGAGATADVTVAAVNGVVRIRVADNGSAGSPGQAPSAPPDAAQHGIVGIRERAGLYGGTVAVGPGRSGTGWIVEVTMNEDAA